VTGFVMPGCAAGAFEEWLAEQYEADTRPRWVMAVEYAPYWWLS
jgi:hypothetical protein